MKDTIALFMDTFILLLLSYFLHERHYFQLISHFFVDDHKANVLKLAEPSFLFFFFSTPSEFLKNAFGSAW